MNILVVEDNKSTLRLLEKKINRWGFAVHLAENGIEALAKLTSSPIDIVLTDWNMPEMDGLEFCRRVRKSDMHYIYRNRSRVLDLPRHTRRGRPLCLP
mgnify:CR=1 FL=1